MENINRWQNTALHVAILDARNKNIFYGIQVGINNTRNSYLQFVDNALIMVKWSMENAKNIFRMVAYKVATLRCYPKWWWRFKVRNLIKSIHGSNRCLSNFHRTSLSSGPWGKIISLPDCLSKI